MNTSLKYYIILGFILVLISFVSVNSCLAPETIPTQAPDKEKLSGLLMVEGNSLLSFHDPSEIEPQQYRKIKMVITAYSSTVCQTDDTPYITASGARVRKGIVANNKLAFGTKIQIPEIYGDKIFTVKDRLHPRKGHYHIDIWFPSKQEAINFGVKITYVKILRDENSVFID